jgi:tetratricopeptide (TPR) repeat protein/tRNA A-37 threonylcarbamoyl transferase component Bud32
MIGKNISRYRILGQVGEGGMGVVYVAEDTVLGRRVAVKIPHAGRDESHYRSRFLREARAVSKLRHENIAAVHDFGETEEGQPFIVMELVSGQTLGEVLSGPGISVARAVEVAGEVAQALSEAHRLGVVHRDIKPSNVVIDDKGTVKVLDFGLAKQLHEEGSGGPGAQTLLTAHTRSDVVIGTPLYLSPEQARGAKVDGRSDLFALGALLYECLTGRPAFSGANVIEIGAQVLHFDPPPPSRLNPRVPAELDRLTLKALAKKPEDRFQTAAEFAAELARVRSRLPDSDTVTTRRLAGADSGHRSSALITMAEGLRRPKFSPLALLASLAGLGLLIWAVWYVRQPSAHVPVPEVAQLYEQGVEAMREGSYHKAGGLLTQAVERDEKFALAHARLAEARLEVDNLDLAKDEMMFVGKLVPDPSIYPRADALYLGAIFSTVNKEYAAAVGSYEEIVKLEPARPQAHLDLGRAYERNNQVEKALASYTEATARDGSYAAAFLRLGTLHVRQKSLAAAANALDHAQRLYAARGSREGEAAVRYQRGRLLAGDGKLTEARAEFDHALRLARESENRYLEVLALLQLASAHEDGGEAEKLAVRAIGIAQSSGMNDQVANGYLTHGNVLFSKLNRLDDAEAVLTQALDYARRYKLRRYVALALTNLGSLSTNRLQPDRAEEYITEARKFYIEGGYRREADACAILIGRSRKLKADYEGALAILEEQLRLADAAGDVGQSGVLHRECGSVLHAQQKYPQALAHYGQSALAAKALGNPTLLNYSLLNQASMFWALGHYAEAAELLGRLTDAGRAQPAVAGMLEEILALAYMSESGMESSRRHFPEAAAKARQALAVLARQSSPSNERLAWVNADLCAAESYVGPAARGRKVCEEALRLLQAVNDRATKGHVQFALALALLEAGDAAGARAAAVRAADIFTEIRSADSQWQALALAGMAARRAGDEAAAHEYTARAATALAEYQRSLGAEAVNYLSRPDVQWLRGELEGSAASTTH